MRIALFMKVLGAVENANSIVHESVRCIENTKSVAHVRDVPLNSFWL